MSSKTNNLSTQREQTNKLNHAQRIRNSPVPDNELVDNMGVYLSRQNLSRIFMIQKLYQLIIPIHGSIMEFGVRWGQNLSLFSNLRGIYEPYNHNRKVVGFDTFAGFPSVDPDKDSQSRVGDYNVTPHWEEELDTILNFHENNAPIPQVRKHELVAGDATQTAEEYLKAHPETIIALAYFDFDIYEPTKRCLELVMQHVTKGSIIAFDELNYATFPGETIALKEVIGLSRFSIRRDPLAPLISYITIE